MLNGRLISPSPISEPDISFASSDSVFETIRYASGKCFLWDLHFERLARGIKTFRIEGVISKKQLEKDIKECCRVAGSPDLKIRITAFPDSSFNRNLNCLIEVSHIDPPAQFVKKISTTLFKDEVKTIDSTSSSKSGNRSIYFMASQFAEKNGTDDCFIINEQGNIIEATISNIFIISNGSVITPPIADGCIEGTMRKHLLAQFDNNNVPCKELSISEYMLENADEVFLVNAVRGIIGVSQFKSTTYEIKLSQEYYSRFFLPHL